MVSAGASAQTNQPTPNPGGTSPPPAGAEEPVQENQQTPPPPTGTQQQTAPAPTENGQQGSTAAGGAQQGQLPPVEVIQPITKQPGPTKPKVVVKKTPAPSPAPPAAAPAPPPAIDADSAGSVETSGTDVPMSPVSGSEIPLGKYPGGVSVVRGSDIGRQFYIDSPEDILQQRVPGVIVNDLQGNSFQTDVSFRGFEASPVNGVPQGLAVYQNGVRINEAFGDIVNWDFLPAVAINTMTVVTNNPVYGLNALGGAITIDMKNGFNYHGAELTSTGGSFGRVGGTAQTGVQSGNWAAYFGGERIEDDGWRQFSPSDVRRMYADLGFKNSDAEFHLNYTGADNFVGVAAGSPVQLLGLGWGKAFTTPQGTTNLMSMESMNGTVKATDTLSFSGVAYMRQFSQSHIDGNISDAADCGPGSMAGTLCLDGGQALDKTGNPIPTPSNPALGEDDFTDTNSKSWGTSLQAVDKEPIFGHTNQFLMGASYDHGNTTYSTSSILGTFGSDFVVDSLGIQFSAPSVVAPRNITALNDYVGAYFSDTFDVNERLSLTGGGRYNIAMINLEDNTGQFPELDGIDTYVHFNPMAGAAYKINPGLSLYGGYSEANRAPVAAELACADPKNPCLIESFLTADPPLQQVVSDTWEMGLRSTQTFGSDKLQWGLGAFRTENINDIITVFSNIAGRGVFQNAGNTLRQGVEANISYKTSKWFFYANYALVDATFLNPLTLTSLSPFATTCPGTDPSADTNCINVRPGDHLPGIPENRVKLGADYWITSKWKFGGDLVAASGQYFFGDESNQDKQVGGYTRVDLHTSYDMTPRLQLYGLINNLFDQHFGLNGGYTEVDQANSASAANPVTGPNFFTNPRSIVPAAPFEVYGGVKIELF